MTRKYTFLRFKAPIQAGGQEIDRWSIKQGQITELASKLSFEDVDGTWLQMTWSGTSPPDVCEIHWSNVTQRKWENVEAPKTKEQKK